MRSPCGWSRWPRVLRRSYVSTRFLWFQVRILFVVWMSVTFECSVLLGRDLCDGPIPYPEESYHIRIINLIKCKSNPLHVKCVGAQRSKWEKKTEEKCPCITIQLLWFSWKFVWCMLYVTEREQWNVDSFVQNIWMPVRKKIRVWKKVGPRKIYRPKAQ